MFFFLCFQKKLNSFWRWNLEQRAVRAFTITGAQGSKKIILFRYLESKRWLGNFFRALKKIWTVCKRGSWEKMKVSCFTETRYHIDFLPLVYSEGLTWRHIVKDPHYSLTFGRNSIVGMFCSLFGLGSRLCLNYMWQTLISKIDWSRVKMTVWEHNWGCVSGSIYLLPCHY